MHSPTAQVLTHGPEVVLIDCGEGTQLKLRRASFNFQRIGHIFISHLHGDHYLGLQGLLSTMHLLGRTVPIHIYAHADLEKATHDQLRMSGSFLRFQVIWHQLTYDGFTQIADLKRIGLYSFPLDHRIPTCGLLVREKPKLRNIRPECIARYRIPIPRIRQIKAGADLHLEDGTVIPNEALTHEPPAPRAYGYCSDTAYMDSTAVHVQGVDLLYHESTFLESERARAHKTHHSTAAQAARVAAKAGAGQLLLGHFSARYSHLAPFLEEATPVFAQTMLASEGETYPIGPVHK